MKYLFILYDFYIYKHLTIAIKTNKITVDTTYRCPMKKSNNTLVSITPDI